MKKDIINGYEWLIFNEDELEAASRAAKTDNFVRVSTICDGCGGYIEASIKHIEDRNSDPDETIMHGYCR